MKKHILHLILILSIFFSRAALTAVYKWTDEAGNIHFGSIPPTQNVEKVMESTPDAIGKIQEKEPPYPLEERIVGTWQGEFRGNFFSLDFYERDTFKLGGKNFRLSRVNTVKGKPGNAHTTIFSGVWEMKGTRILFHRKKEGPLYRLYPDYKSALVVKQVNISLQGDTIDLIFDNNDRFKGKRYLGAGNMPSYMRRR